MLTFCSKNFAAGLEEVVGIGVEVGMVEVVVGVEAAVILSPTRTYFPDLIPASTSSHGMKSPFSSYTVTVGPGTVVVVA